MLKQLVRVGIQTN